MKATKVLFAASTFVALVPLARQGQSQTNTDTYIATTTIVGSRVTGPEGNEVGQITNIVLDRETGCMAYVVLSAESSGSRKTVAVPWTVFSPGSDSKTYSVRVDKEKIVSGPVWEASRLEDYNRSEWVENVYAYYGAQPGAGENANVGSRSADRDERRRQRREERMERHGGQRRNADMRMERERGQRGMNRRPGAEPTASPTPSESPRPQPGTPLPSPSSNPGSQPHEAAPITPSATPSEPRNPDELRPPPTGGGPGASATPGS
jgi:sporulation protein YlmC with PRC-barrel domain